MKDIKTQQNTYTKMRLSGTLNIIVLIALLSLTSSCVEVFKHENKLDENAASDIEIPKGIYVYNDYFKSIPLIKVLLLKGVNEFNLSISVPFEIHTLDNTLLEAEAHAASHSGNATNILEEIKYLPKSIVKLTDTHIVIGERKYIKKPVEFLALKDGEITVNDIKYWGKIQCIPQANGTFLVIEETNVENYLTGVLPSEMQASWTNNTLFAQAVAARTYALYKKKKRNTELYHVDKLDLAYKGRLNENKKTNEIINKSKGIIMVSDWLIFPGYFHSTCGGYTEDVTLIFKEKSIKPLSGVKCGYCTASQYYRWQVYIDKNEIARNLKNINVDTGNPFSIRPVDLGPGGHAAAIEVKNSSGIIKRIDANTFRLSIGSDKLYSTSFKTDDTADGITFSGRGWGHGVGLCQYGSQKMGLSGFKWHEIVKYYYQGIELVKIY